MLTSALQDAILQVVDGTSRDLRPILREDVYRIAGKAVRNALTLIGIIRLRESDRMTVCCCVCPADKLYGFTALL